MTGLFASAPEPARAARPVGSGRSGLTLIGAGGGPPPWGGRSGISSAIQVEDRTYLIDLGHGAFEGTHKAGIEASGIRSVFVTHLHSDHIADLYTVPWLRHGGIRSVDGPIDLYGPGPAGALPPPNPPDRQVSTVSPDNPTPGTVDFIDKAIEASAYDLNIRMRDEAWPDIRSVLRAHDIALPEVGASATGNLWPDMDPFTVLENDDVKVSATLVQHPPVFPSFAFRFDTDDGSVVFSGDTSASANLVRLADDVDILVHEVIDLDWVAEQNVPDSLLKHLAASHTDVNRVGAIAERAGAKTLVLNHLVPGDPSSVNDGQWLRRAQRGYSGKVILGHDLMQLDIG
ncbi:MBL fold metallo-hydrolase [Haloactinomyces albus]|uniref:Ribonuclease BN (tRNA processing enzyme) n=1 Tax=Haloactinomyces albus TaxID=1352928 RepID=A0AAE3ZHE0_9ACTN|nr:MBL fold metallo-hydrolase [Haloactinomyces albus]MDR7303653.1 ribonuclease BN (tRNA processing enzyme) [Haloactinomyces albus]